MNNLNTNYERILEVLRKISNDFKRLVLKFRSCPNLGHYRIIITLPNIIFTFVKI